MLIFEEGGKPEKPRSKDGNQQQAQPTYDIGSRIRTRATLVGGERDHHCAIPARQDKILCWDGGFSFVVKDSYALHTVSIPSF